MDGFETLRKIRNKQITVEAIMVTAANDRDSLEEALHLSIVDYLVKPFTFDRFQMALEKYIAQNNALKDIDTLNQTSIDHIIDNSRGKSEDLFPKGIQERTLQLIMEYLNGNKNEWFAGDDIAAKVGLTGVTVRRYMNYLAESGRVVGEMNYETGGRPCMRYKVEWFCSKIQVTADGTFDRIGLSEKIESDIKELIDFEDLDSLADRIIDYFIKLLSGA